MKVNELREKLKNRKKDELQKMIVEMYKQIPKKTRETKEIDELIDNPDLFKTRKRSTRKSAEMPDFADVEYEVKKFIKNAYEQNYVAPNRVIPKKERSKWRFTAKRPVDQLTALSGMPEHARASANYLEQMYELLCYACSYYTFTSEEPFHTIKIPQTDFYGRVVSLKKQVGDPDDWIRESLLLIVENGVDHETLTISLSEVLLEALNNAPLKEKAVSIAEDLVHKKEAEVSTGGQLNWRSINYRDEEYINDLVEMIVMTQSALGEYEAANEFFKKHYISSREEVNLYVLLKLVMSYQRVADWLNEYELAVKNGVEPRESLQTTYKKIKRTKEFPEYISVF